MTRQVLVVGGATAPFEQLKSALSKEPYELTHASRTTEALDLLSRTKPSAVLAYETIDGGGSAFLTTVLQKSPTAVRLLIIEKADPQTLIHAVNEAEIYRFLSPPLEPALVARILRNALTIARVAEAQEAVWLAAKQQQVAMARLLSPGEASWEQADGAVLSSRFARQRPHSETETDRIGDLPDEQAQRLSVREREIVEALGAGRRVKDIAMDLVISTHTVRNHLKAIYRKLNVRSQFELISLMARHSKESS